MTDPVTGGAIGNSGIGDAAAGDAGTAEVRPDPAPPGLDETTLEALLFVAERPLSRREIAGLAGVTRDEVDARLGDLEVSLRSRGIRLVLSGDRVELATTAEAGPLIARYLGVDAIRLTPAGEVSVVFSDRTDGRMVVADAIAWSPVGRPAAASGASE